MSYAGDTASGHYNSRRTPRGGKVNHGRVTLDFPAGPRRGEPLAVRLTVRDRLPESPHRRLHLVFDVEASEPVPMNGQMQTRRKVSSFKRPVALEVDLTSWR